MKSYLNKKYIEEWTPQGASLLRTGIELGRETSRDSGNQVIFVEGGDSFLLRRRPYDQTFKREQYSPDPSESGSSTLRGQFEDWWAGVEARSAAKAKEQPPKLAVWLDAKQTAWETRRNQRAADKLKAKQARKDVAGE